MNCPNCTAEMTAMTLAANVGTRVEIDVCTGCQAFWFDRWESLKLTSASTLRLMKLIGDHSAGKTVFAAVLKCPRCNKPLRTTNDRQRNTRFTYWKCRSEHGRFIRFFEFLREKEFIRALSPQQITELRKTVQTVNCSNCGAPIDLATGVACTHCGSPLSMLDMKQPQELLNKLKDAADPKPMDPDLTWKLALAKRDVELLFGPEKGEARRENGRGNVCSHAQPWSRPRQRSGRGGSAFARSSPGWQVSTLPRCVAELPMASILEDG